MRALIISMLPGSQVIMMVTLIMKMIMTILILSGSPNTDMEFVKNFTPLDFQAKNFTPSISPNFNSLSDKNTKK